MAVNFQVDLPVGCCPLAADPTSGNVGDVYFNTTTNRLRECTSNSPTWSDVGGGSGVMPIIMTQNLTLSSPGQYLFRIPINLGSYTIIAGSGAVLVGI
jgi:hypothetical protein